MITLAYVAASFGLKGYVKLKVHTEYLDSVVQYDPVYLVHGNTVLTTRITEHFIKNGVIYVLFDNIADRTAADNLKSFSVCIKEEQLPKLPDGEFYWNDLLGYTVINLKGENIGVFDSLCDVSATDILIVKTSAKDILIPFVPELYVKTIDSKHRQIIVDWELDWEESK